MSWMPEERALLLRLAESGVLRREQLAGAGARAPLRPTPAEWRSALDHVFALGGALLLAAAVVFFIAYNWEAMHRFARLGLAIGVLAAFCGGALLARPAGVGWRAALFGACVASGAVLALVGQTYQTGADVWELFAAWAALMLPFAWLARSSASWMLWLGVANLALMRALSQSAWWGFIDTLSNAETLLAIAAFNLLVLLILEAFGAVLLALRQALRSPHGTGAAGDCAGDEASRPMAGEEGAGKAGSGLRLGVGVALALVVGVSVWAVIDREQVLERGRVVLFELAPIDPRSLMQGDYMALRFAIDGALPRRDGASAGRLPRFAYLDVDAEGRARLVGVGDELPESSARVAVRIRMRDGAPSVGPNAFFFQEGQADVFAGARWGELRVAADGTALLADLRDENLQRLGAPRR